jgi:uncharacterized protein YjbI with pentapeptide repeats
MANKDQVAILKKGVKAWHAWRRKNPDIRPDLVGGDVGVDALNKFRKNPDVGPDLSGANLSGLNLMEANFREANLSGANLRKADLFGAYLSGANLRAANLSGANLRAANLMEANLRKANLSGKNLIEANLREANLSGANLRKADLSGADLMEANLREANLSGANLREARLFGANLRGANLRGANLIEANLREANLSGGANLSGANLDGANLIATNLRKADLIEASLQSAILIGTNFSRADLTDCRIYGLSAWNLKLDGAKQQNLVITRHDEPEITVDNIEVAQFIYLLLHNEKIRDAIDTITSKAVLILGRFTDERKAVLDALRDELRNCDLLPILFDFPPSKSLDVTETIKVLAGLARFVIADVTDATEVRVELHSIVNDFTSLPIQPILLRGREPFVSLSHVKKFKWVLPTFEYDDQKHLLRSLNKRIIGPAEKMVRKLRS